MCIPASHPQLGHNTIFGIMLLATEGWPPGSCRKAPKRNTRTRKTQCFWHPDGCDPSWYPMHFDNIGRASLANLGSSSSFRRSLL